MKKADPFHGIPAVPDSIAGQWLAFNHMANHYRKLLNVKPRVNSSAPKVSSSSHFRGALPLSMYLKGAHLLPRGQVPHQMYASTSCLTGKKGNGKGKGVKGPQITSCHEVAVRPDSNPSSPNPKRRTSTMKSIKNKTNSALVRSHAHPTTSNANNPHLLFGPYSLKSSTDALVSDCDSQPEVPRVATMGVAEKIKVFLKHLHHYDEPERLQKKKCKKVQQVSEEKKPRIRGIPTYSDQRAEERRLRTLSSHRHSQCFQPVSADSPRSVRKTLLTKPVNSTPQLSTAIQNANNKSAHLSKSVSHDVRQQRYVSGGSIGSVGTIRGSEELAGEDNLSLPTQSGLNLNVNVPLVTSKVRPPKSDRCSRTRTPSAGYGSQSASGKATGTSVSSTGVLPHHHNNDSSRDSAYGFSSGESRVTTRDSTPEKVANHAKRSRGDRKERTKERGKYKSALSTVASSVNMDSVAESEKRNKMTRKPSEEKYLSFLNEVTEDIVMRGIYTNRGLKILFQEHLQRHEDLSITKMTDMLENLRIELGIPKDDHLNTLEFGYGSVLSPTGPGSSYTSSLLMTKDESLLLSQRQSDSEGAQPFSPPSRKTLTFHPSERDSGSELDLSEATTSLSETELKRTLKEVGIDSTTTLEIVGMIKHKNPAGTSPTFSSSHPHPHRSSSHSGRSYSSSASTALSS